MSTKAASQKGVAALVLLAATVALATVLARYLGTGFSLLQQVYLRVFVALVLALIVFSRHLRWQVIASLPITEWSIIAFRGFAGYVIGVTLMSQAVITTAIGNVTFIAALPFVPLLGFILLKEEVTWWKLLFIAGSLFGVALIATKDWAHPLSWQPGDVLAVAGTLGLALSYVARKWHNGTLNNQEITTLTFVFGGGFTLLLSVLFGEGMPPLIASQALWLAVLFGGALNVIKLFLTNYGFQRVDAVQGGNLLTLEGVWGVVFGFIFYSEWPTWHGLLGGTLIAACAIGMNVYSKRGEAKMAAPPEGVLFHTNRGGYYHV